MGAAAQRGSDMLEGPSMRMRSGRRCASRRARSTSGGEPISATSMSV
jgi:hypothetical protein